MLSQVGLSNEGLPTLAALVSPFSSVDFLVFVKYMLVPTGYLTVVALVRPFSGVASPVLEQAGVALKQLSTRAALVRPFACVDLLMSKESAHVRPFSIVTFPVFDELRDAPQ